MRAELLLIAAAILAIIGAFFLGPAGLLVGALVLPVAIWQRLGANGRPPEREFSVGRGLIIWSVVAVLFVTLGWVTLFIPGALIALAVEPVAALIRGPQGVAPQDGMSAAFHMVTWVPPVWPVLYGVSSWLRPAAHVVERGLWIAAGSYLWALALWSYLGA